MLRRRHTNHENPAWPGLVDLFAVSLVVFVVVMVAMSATQAEPKNTLSPEEQKELKGKLAALEDSVPRLIKELDKSQKEFSDLEKKYHEAEQVKNRLEAEKVAFEQDAKDAKEKLTAQARALTEKLRASLQEELGSDWGVLEQVDPNLPEFRITEFRGKSIVFNSAKWDLSAKDEKALLEFRSTLAEVLHGFPKALIEVNGTSDPRPYRVKGQVRDNIDLSAMRAATVAKLLAATDETSGEVITNDILVVGLGETGEVITDGVDLQIAYAKYRTVTLKLRIPLEGL